MLGFYVVGREYAQTGGWGPVAGIAIFGGFVEGVGVATGWPFGAYYYTDRWFPTQWLGQGRLPMQVPFAWALVTLGSLGVARLVPALRSNIFLISVAAGLVAALVDLVMEPVMTGPLSYWHWNPLGPLPGGAPLANFFGWWGTAAAGAAIAAWFLRCKCAESRESILTLSGHLALVLGIGLISVVA